MLEIQANSGFFNFLKLYKRKRVIISVKVDFTIA